MHAENSALVSGDPKNFDSEDTESKHAESAERGDSKSEKKKSPLFSKKKNGRMRLVATVAAASLIVLGAGATIAGLSSQQTLVNNVNATETGIVCDVDEGGWDPNNARNVVPLTTFVKEPKIINQSDTPVWAIMTVKMPTVTASVEDDWYRDSDNNPQAVEDFPFFDLGVGTVTLADADASNFHSYMDGYGAYTDEDGSSFNAASGYLSAYNGYKSDDSLLNFDDTGLGNGWMLCSVENEKATDKEGNEDDHHGYVTYTFLYKDALKAAEKNVLSGEYENGGETTTLFNSVLYKNMTENANLRAASIIVMGYVVQQPGHTSARTAWDHFLYEDFDGVWTYDDDGNRIDGDAILAASQDIAKNGEDSEHWAQYSAWKDANKEFYCYVELEGGGEKLEVITIDDLVKAEDPESVSSEFDADDDSDETANETVVEPDYDAAGIIFTVPSSLGSDDTTLSAKKLFYDLGIR